MGYIGAGLTRFNTADELTVTGDAEFDGNLTVKGTHITLDSATVQTVDLGDNDKIRLGDSDDLQIYHDAGNSRIVDAGTGNLNLQADNNINILNNAGTEFKAQFITNGAVNLFYDNSKKLETTATGVDISNSSGATLKLTSTDTTGADTELLGQIDFVSSDTSGGSAGTQARIKGVYEDNGDSSGIAFLTGNSTGSGSPTLNEVMRIRHEGNVGIGQTNPAFLLTAEGDKDTWISRIYNTGSDANASALLVRSDATAAHDAVVFGVYADSEYKFVVRSSGNVGIGTSSPNYKFQVGDATADTRAIFNPNTGFAIGVANGGGFAGWIGGSGVTDNMVFSSSGGTERMRIDSSGNVGIATTSPAYQLQVGEGNGQMSLGNATSGNGSSRLKFLSSNSQKNWQISTNDNVSGALEFTQTTAGGGTTFSSSPAMLINSSGKLCVGTSTAVSLAMLTIQPADTNRIINTRNFNTSTQYHHVFQNSAGTTVGSIQCNNAATAYNTTSDYRLKTDVTYDWDATSRLKQLKPARFEWIIDGDDAVPVDGFLAHEVQDIVPEAISGTKDGMMDEEYTVSAATGDIYTPAVEATYDEDGVEVTAAVDEVIHSADVEQPEELAEGQQWRETTAAVIATRSVPDYQGIDQSKLVPLLVKTIQELEARIAALETA